MTFVTSLNSHLSGRLGGRGYYGQFRRIPEERKIQALLPNNSDLYVSNIFFCSCRLDIPPMPCKPGMDNTPPIDRPGCAESECGRHNRPSRSHCEGSYCRVSEDNQAAPHSCICAVSSWEPSNWTCSLALDVSPPARQPHTSRNLLNLLHRSSCQMDKSFRSVLSSPRTIWRHEKTVTSTNRQCFARNEHAPFRQPLIPSRDH